jgi:hypothetical protein
MTRTFTLERTGQGCVMRDSDKQAVYDGPSPYPPVSILETLARKLSCRISDLSIETDKETP